MVCLQRVDGWSELNGNDGRLFCRRGGVRGGSEGKEGQLPFMERVELRLMGSM